MREDNPYCCSHYSTGFHSPRATQGCQEGNLKGAQSCGNKGRVLRRRGARRIPQRPFEKSGGYPPTDWLHLHWHCLFMWQMGPINFIAGLTVIKLTKLAGRGASRHLEGSVAAIHERQMGVIFPFFFFGWLMLNVVVFLVCRNRATHLISSLNNISRLSRRSVFVRQARRMNHCVSVERLREPLWRAALCALTQSPTPRFIPPTMLQQSGTNLSWNFKLRALIEANQASQNEANETNTKHVFLHRCYLPLLLTTHPASHRSHPPFALHHFPLPF